MHPAYRPSFAPLTALPVSLGLGASLRVPLASQFLVVPGIYISSRCGSGGPARKNSIRSLRTSAARAAASLGSSPAFEEPKTWPGP